MIKRAFLCLAGAALVVPTLLALPIAVSAADGELEVGPSPTYPYQTIQDAVNAASPGDTIFVHDTGVAPDYCENVDVGVSNLAITVSDGEEVTVEAANPNDHVFCVMASSITIEGFIATGATELQQAGIFLASDTDHCTISDNTVTGNRYGIVLNYSVSNTVSNNIIDSNAYGIALYSSDHNAISNNAVDSNDDLGIYLGDSDNNTISGNTASNTLYGINLYQSCKNTVAHNTAVNNDRGILLSSSDNNTISGNTADLNTSRGIHLSESDTNTVSENTCLNNLYGINLYVSRNNTLSDNKVNSNEYSIYMYGADDNTVYLNNLSGNIWGVLSESDSNNAWHSPTEFSYLYNGASFHNHMGNYWGSSYSGIDSDGDGIGETPYYIVTDEDGYPLVDTPDQYTDIAPVTPTVDDIDAYIKGLENNAFKNRPRIRKARLARKLAVVERRIERGRYGAAIYKLRHDIQPKMNGSLTPRFRWDDRNDWITDREAQHDLCEMIDNLIVQLRTSQ
jgi:parallel beta-helix repeat protein